MSTLNEQAWQLCEAMAADADTLGIVVHTLACGTRVVDCGVAAPGGIESGRRLAEVCMAGLGEIEIQAADPSLWRGQAVDVRTDRPVAACMAAQYAGWEIIGERFFAMGSGPMRAAAAREPLFNTIDCCEKAERCVGVLETSQLPPEGVCLDIAGKCSVHPGALTLLAARTASWAGTVQIVARSIETALHKLHELGFDLTRIEKGRGSAPLPPVGDSDLAAIGLTNDAILLGGCAELFVHGDDASLEEIGPHVPSCASPDFGRPFAEIFARYDHDFYRIDPLLFSPALVRFYNLDTDRSFEFGQFAPELLVESFSRPR
jgi:methenyltetrahydromethanopterin cyclohydrolase